MKIKTTIAVVVAAAFVLTLWMPVRVEAKTKRLVLSNHLNAEMLKGVKAKKKKVENGVSIIFTSKKEEKIKMLSDFFKKVMVHAKQSAGEAGHENELMYWAEVESSMTAIENGLQLDFTSEISGLPKKMQKVTLPCQAFDSSFRPGLSSGNGDDGGGGSRG